MREPPAESAPPITRQEWMWVVVVGLIILLLTSLPYLVGLLHHEPDAVFTGVIFIPPDAYSYYAKMRFGAQGEWLFQNVYALEPHARTVVYLPYVLLGNLARPFGGARASFAVFAVLYHALRIIAGAVFLWTLYRFYARLFADVGTRRFAFVLGALGGGLGAAATIAGFGIIGGDRPLDLFVGESYGYIALFSWPHVLLGRTALLASVIHFEPFLAGRDATPRDGLILALLWLVMTLGVPYYLLITAVLFALWVALQAALTRTIPWRAILLGGAAALPAAALSGINLWIMRGDVVYQSWIARNVLPFPGPVMALITFGLPLLLAICGAALLRDRRDPAFLVCLAWIATAAILTQTPINVAMRMTEGAFIGMWGLAAFAIRRVLRPLPSVARLAAMAAICVVTFSSATFFLLRETNTTLSGSENAYTPRSVDNAYRWLNQNAPLGAILIAAPVSGEYAPARAPIRPVAGHSFETPDYARKWAILKAFYDPQTRTKSQQELIAQAQADYVLLGPQEYRLMCGEPRCDSPPFDANALNLATVFEEDGVTIYAVIR